METHPVFGLSIPQQSWVPSFSYLLRRDRIFRLLHGVPAGPLLEVGCGSGALLVELARLGFQCSALETSPAAARLARHVAGAQFEVHGTPPADWKDRFDYLLALEVLEHIEDDRGALALWRGWIAPNGSLILSVPGHLDRWTSSDVWAGHYRRYERDSLISLLQESGFAVEHIETYGFPLKNVAERLRAIHHRRELRRSEVRQLALDRAQSTARSGTERTLEVKLYPVQRSWIGVKLVQLAISLQDKFSQTDWGNGYIVRARRI